MKVEKPGILIYCVCLLWCGILIGVSFIATPAKFMVPELDIVTAIKVGRATFHVFHYVELSIAIFLVFVLCFLRAGKAEWTYFSVLGAILFIQYSLVQPLVEAASDALFLSGVSGSKRPIHLFYILCDCLKLVMLLAFYPAIYYVKKT